MRFERCILARVKEQERSGRLALLQLVFTLVMKHGWEAVRETHGKVVELVQSGDLAWSDDLEHTFELLLEVREWSKYRSSSALWLCKYLSAAFVIN